MHASQHHTYEQWGFDDDDGIYVTMNEQHFPQKTDLWTLQVIHTSLEGLATVWLGWCCRNQKSDTTLFRVLATVVSRGNLVRAAHLTELRGLSLSLATSCTTAAPSVMNCWATAPMGSATTSGLPAAHAKAGRSLYRRYSLIYSLIECINCSCVAAS